MFGMHPAMAPLKPLWDAGTFGVVHAVGQAQPNRSHFSAMEELERAAPGTSMRTGWLDRVLGVRGPGTAFQGMQLGSSMAALAFLGPSRSSRCGRSIRSAWTRRGTRSSAGCGTRRCAGLHTGAPDALKAPAQAALGALNTDGGAAGVGYAPGERRGLPGLRPGPRAERRRPADQGERRTAGRGRRLRRLGHARRDGRPRQRMDARPPDRAVAGDERVRDDLGPSIATSRS